MADKANGLMQIGSRISVCRQNKNMTQEELAYKLGITPQALSKWERGLSFPDISMLADISRMLEVSADYLLGISVSGVQNNEGNGENPARAAQIEVQNNLRNALEPLMLRIGVGLVPRFMDNGFVPKVLALRKSLSVSGILLPIVRIMDSEYLEEQEFMILAYDNVLYSEVLEQADEGVVDYIIQKLGEVAKEKYDEILNPDIIKDLVENLKIRYPALIEGVVPEKIPYSLLMEVTKKIVARGDGVCYLPKMIEVMDCALRADPGISAEELAERVARRIEREDNFHVLTAKRNVGRNALDERRKFVEELQTSN